MSLDRTLVWFSCGAASAVAAKIACLELGDACEVLYCDTFEEEHPDNKRFFKDVEKWIERPIKVLKSNKYGSVSDVINKTRFMSGQSGARCTVEMKKAPRLEYQTIHDTHIFGYTSEEKRRADTFESNNPDLFVDWILIRYGVSKKDCLAMLEANDIRLPAMYDLGFDHNNCIGCVKSTSPGYWNRVRRLFPDMFKLRAAQSRLLGVRLVRVKGERVFLDELPPEEYAPDDDIECGPVCQAGALTPSAPRDRV